ncbi:MAG: hypothetical protein U9R75_09635, partial [Candidatus Thermoplasmatota archaeon]|nr:hypothetical protein [Candidatus Thermoplasmatota archaeon]
MTSSDKDTAEASRKLEMIINKGDMIINVLEKQGIETDIARSKITMAKDSFSGGDLKKAYKLAQECISYLMNLRERVDKPKLPAKGKKGKGVFALIRDNSSDIKRKTDEWKIITNGWREKGYEFETDPSLFSRNFDDIEKRFISIGGQIEKAEIIRRKLNRIRDEFPHVGRSYGSKIDDIEKATFKLDRLDSIEKRVESLKITIGSVEGRFKTLRNRISRFRRNELNTSSLDEMLENDEDLDYLDKQFNNYESNVEFLMKEKQKLNSFKNDPTSEKFRKNISDLEKIIKDPWKLDQIVENMLTLEKEIIREKENRKRKNEESSRRGEIKASLDKYGAEGFKTEMVEQLLDEDMNLLEEEFDIFIRQTVKLKSIKEKLFKLDAAGFEEEVSEISSKLMDPAGIDDVERELDDLKETILKVKVRSQKIEGAIKEWSGMGYKITKLENALENDMELADDIFEDYSERIHELMDYENKLKGLNNKDLNDMIHRVNLKLKNPEHIKSIRKDMEFIMDKVTVFDDLREKRKELNNLLKIWKKQGYKIERILAMMREATTKEALERVILDNTRAIASLEAMKADLPSEERGWFPVTENFIMENLDDPERSNDVLSKFSKLKRMNLKEEKKRGEISRKLKELSNRDINISRINPYLLGDSETLDKEYAVFKDKIKRLLKIKANLLKQAKKEKDQGKEMLSKSFNDPYSIEQYEDHISGKRSTPKKGRDTEENKDQNLQEIDELKEMAKKNYRENRLEEALRLFKIILSMNPDHKESQFYIKKVNLKMKSVDYKETDESSEERTGQK